MSVNLWFTKNYDGDSRLILSKGADVNSISGQGYTPLHMVTTIPFHHPFFMTNYTTTKLSYILSGSNQWT